MRRRRNDLGIKFHKSSSFNKHIDAAEGKAKIMKGYVKFLVNADIQMRNSKRESTNQ